MPKLKRPLNPLPQRPPEWLDEPKLRAAFLGGLRDAAMQQGQFMTQQRGEARVERGEAENLRRWELLRGERKEARDWQQTLEEQKRLENERQRERQEAADKLAQKKWAHTLAEPERQFESAKQMAEWTAKQELLRKQAEWTREADAEEELEAFGRAYDKEGKHPEGKEQAMADKRRRLGLPAKVTPYKMDPDSPEVQRVRAIIWAQPWTEYEKHRAEQHYWQTGELLSPQKPEVPATKDIGGRVMAWDENANNGAGGFTIDYGPVGKPEEIDWQMEATNLWLKYAKENPVIAIPGVSGRNKKNWLDHTEEDRLKYVQSWIEQGRKIYESMSPPAAQQQPAPVVPAAQPAQAAPGQDSGFSVGPMSIGMQDVGAAVPGNQATADIATMSLSAAMGTPREKIIAAARKGDKKAQTYLKSIGVQW